MSHNLLPDIHLFLNQSGRDLFGFNMDEKKLGGSYVQADIVDQLGFLLAGDVVFDEKRQALSSSLGEKGNLLLVTPIQLFDESMENAPSTSFASQDGLFVSKRDLFEHLKLGKEKTRLWLLEGAKTCAQAFIQQNTASKETPLPTEKTSFWRISSWEEFVAVFPNDREILRRHLSFSPITILTRLLAATSENTPLNQQLQKINITTPPDPDIAPSVYDSMGCYLSPSWLNKFKKALKDSNNSENEAFLNQSMSSLATGVGSKGPLFCATAISLFGKAISSIEQEEGYGLVSPTTAEQMGKIFASNPLSVKTTTSLFVRAISRYGSFDPLFQKDQDKNNDVQFLTTMFSLSDNGTLSKNILLSDISVKQMTDTFNYLLSCANLDWMDLVTPNIKNTNSIQKTISLLTDKNMEALTFSDFKEIGKLSLKTIVDHKAQVLSLWEKQSTTNTPHPLLGLLSWHRPTKQSSKDVGPLFDMFLNEPPLCNNENKKADTLFHLAMLAIQEKENQHDFSKEILNQVSYHLDTLLDREDFSPGKTTWKLMEKLASSHFAFPDFQHELSLKMKERGFLDIEGNQKNQWKKVQENLKNNQNPDVQLAFKQTLNLLEKDEILSHVSLSFKNKEVMPQPASFKKSKM